MTTTKKDIGDRIKQACLRSGVKQNELAKLTGIAESTISAIINGDRYPNVEKLASICEAIGASIDSIITGREPTATSSPKGVSRDDILREALKAAITGDRELINEVMEEMGTLSASLDKGEQEILAVYRQLSADDRLQLIKTAKGWQAVSESRRIVGGGSGSTERNST